MTEDADSPELTNAEKIRGLPWAVASNVANTIFNRLTASGGTIFILFLNELGLSKTQLGVTLSLTPFLGLLALFIAPTVARLGYKRIFLAFWGARSAATALLLLIPLILTRYGAGATFAYVIVVVALRSICQTINVTASHPWAQEFVPNSVRGKFSAANNLLATISGLLVVTGAGYVLASSTGLSRFTLLIGIGVFFSLFAIWAMSFVPGGAAITSGSKTHRPHLRTMLEALGDKNFLRYLIGMGLVVLGSVPLGSFFPLFMQEKVGLSSGQVVWLQTGSLVGALLSGYLWGWAADRYGSKPVMLSSLQAGTLLSICWLLMPRHSVWSLYVALFIAFLGGLVGGGWSIGCMRILYVSVVPPDKKTQYLALFQAWIGLVTGFSQLLAGRLLDYSRDISGQFLFLTFSPYLILFAARLILPTLSILFLRTVRADETVTAGQFVGMFLRGSPIMAMESLIGFHRAKDEDATVAMTERLGQTKSPLIIKELLEALSDPRFNVRFEAIISIARTRPDEKLTQALVRVLRGSEPALSVIAAWALGRIGDEEAIGPLREGLSARYYSVQIHSARALGALEDRGSIPLLLERLDQETDRSVRIAYASVLGQLGAAEATAPLLALLRAEQEGNRRIELALALARIVGDEHQFIQLLRQTRAETGTPISQAVLAFKKRIDKLLADGSDLPDVIDQCANAWAKEELARGAALLRRLILLMAPAPQESTREAGTVILQDCAERLAEFDAARLEYVLLAVHTLNTGWL